MRASRDADLRVRGASLATRFVIAMTAALTLVMGAAAALIYLGANNIVEEAETAAESFVSRGLCETAQLGHQLEMARDRALAQNKDFQPWRRLSNKPLVEDQETGVDVYPARSTDPVRDGALYVHRFIDEQGIERTSELFVPLHRGQGAGTAGAEDLLGLIVGVMLMVVLVGAGVAFWVAGQVSRPIRRIIDDVRQIAKGDLSHKTHAVGGGEIELLARSIDRMTRELDSAQDAQVELSVREREMDLASGVREALVPLATPWVEGFDVGAARISADHIGGDFHDFIELEDGRVGLLVCDVSGTGVPAALVGATARSYLRSELRHGGEVDEAMRRINRWLVGDVRRGMFVTALYALVDPAEGAASVVCAGHKVPLLRFTAADGKLRVVHPEGIALGFDKGPVFDKRLEVQRIAIEPGDRLLLCNSGPVTIINEAGEELGEKPFYSRVLRHAPRDTPAFLKGLRRDLEQFAGEEEIPVDISLVTIARPA